MGGTFAQRTADFNPAYSFASCFAGNHWRLMMKEIHRPVCFSTGFIPALATS
jgi:hypothetical protein